MRNIYFDLTMEFNTGGDIAVLTSGQAAVWYRTAIMSKDGDWVLRETGEACRRVLDVLADRGAKYRIGAPLDVRWLSGGWSAHTEFRDDRGRRVRCDFLTRPPRLPPSEIEGLFRGPSAPDQPHVIDLENLIRMKQTQRAKDYAVIGELARLLPPEREIQYTTDPDRIIALAGACRSASDRLPVKSALSGASREEVAVALARETFALQEADRLRLERYVDASRTYLSHLIGAEVLDVPIEDAHQLMLSLAEEHLPTRVEETTP